MGKGRTAVERVHVADDDGEHPDGGDELDVVRLLVDEKL